MEKHKRVKVKNSQATGELKPLIKTTGYIAFELGESLGR